MTRYYGLRDWEWMIRTAAQPEIPEHQGEDPYDEFSDIWQQSRGGRNPAGEQWLNDRVRYDRPDTAYPERLRPTDWIGRPETSLPSQDPQSFETNRDIDGSHEAFMDALARGEESEYGMQYTPGGQYEPEPWNPTSEERLNSDEGWLLGPNKTFNWPGGRDKYAAMHNGMHSRGFELEDHGSDGVPSPAYVHRQTGARIIPGYDAEGNPNWHMNAPGPGGVTEHTSPASAAAMHTDAMAARAQREAEEYQRRPHRERFPEEYQNYDSGGRRTRSPGTPRRPESPDYIPKTKAQGMRWQDLFDEAIHGNGGQGREFERASVKSVLSPHQSQTGRLYGVHEQQWDKDHQAFRQGTGKVSQAIYHYATPIAWKFQQADADGNLGEGKWRVPATSFGSGGFFSTGRVQGLMGPSFYRHPDSYEHLRDPQISFHTHRAMEDAGIHRQPDQSYKSIDIFGNEHHLDPSQSGQTFAHTVTTPEGRTFKKRVPVGEGAETAYTMTQAPGAGGPADGPAFLKAKGYRDSAHTPRRRRDVPLRLQPELPGMPRQSSYADILGWSENLRG